MDPILQEWGSFLLRWVHVITAIAWIGASFYFMHLDASLRPTPALPAGKGGEAWEVHGGGFYQVQKYMVAPAHMPEHLIWHKWQAYSTWISGFFLLGWIYYGSPDLYLIDPAVRDIGPVGAAAVGIGGLLVGWVFYDQLCKSRLGDNDFRLGAVLFVFVIAVAFVFQQVFSGRGAMLHTGAVMATIMTANVAMNIIPGQRKVVAALKAGQEPDPAIGKAAKQRSTHNNYLTLPVLFFMMSNHYPHTWSTRWAWVIVALVLVAGALVRHFYNVRHSGGGDPWWMWGAAAVCVLLAVGISYTSSPLGRERLGLSAAAAPVEVAAATPSSPHPAPPAEAVEIVVSRCSMCHAAEPVWAGIAIAPKGVMLDTPERIARQAEAIRYHAVLTASMPPNNITGLEPDERRVLAEWLARAK
jgi:uncharacterized membrane protein